MKITFSCSQKYFDRVEKKDFPCPASSAIENWYKPIKHDDLKKTLKGCMPFLDGMTAGYVLKLPQDFAIGLNHTDQQNNCLMHRVYPSTNDNFNEDINLNHGSPKDWHSIQQTINSPFLEKNGNLPIYKILNPWIITTPIGYSCLFIPPIGSKEDRFNIIPAIVDTDKFNLEINFPIVFNTEKYKQRYDGILLKGSPYVQVIPFKRECWNMKVDVIEKKIRDKNIFRFISNIAKVYKLQFRTKKIWK
jgi:hypothetical protein